MFKHSTSRDEQSSLAGAAYQLNRSNAVTPQSKEVVVDPNPGKPQHIGKQTAQDLLLRAARQTAQRRPKLRSRQRPPVKLAVRRQRQMIQHHNSRRNHVVRQTPPQRRPQRRNVQTSPRRRHHIADQTPVPGNVLARNHRSLRNTRLTRQRRLNLPRLNPEAPDLHLAVRPRARSPLRYIRLPAAPNGSATNRSAVSPERPR